MRLTATYWESFISMHVCKSILQPSMSRHAQRNTICICHPHTITHTHTYTHIHTHTCTHVYSELNALVGVYDKAVSYFGSNQNGIILGDFNAGCSYLNRAKESQLSLKNDPRFKWLIERDVKTTLGSSDCAYDRYVSVGLFKGGT